MSVKILLIQFRTNPKAVIQEKESVRRELGDTVVLETKDALDFSIDWNFPETIMEPYQGVILGGSGDLDFDGNRPEGDVVRRISYELLGRLRPLFQYLFDKDIPTLGICYGHQILGAFAGAQVKCDDTQRKTKSHEVKMLVDKNDYFLFTNLPESFFAHYGHKDSLDRVPEGATLLMNGGDSCRVSALRYKNNIYTTQFHPEMSYLDIMERVKSIQGYLPEGVAVEEIFKEDPNPANILRNFAKLVIAEAK